MLGSVKSQSFNVITGNPQIDSKALNSRYKYNLSEPNLDKNSNQKWSSFSLLDKLQWSLSNKSSPDESNIIDKFIKVIQTEDEEDNTQSTFYNHPSRRRTDREAIRRKLAMGADDESERFFQKPNLQSRLQSGMNLQICFMNETVSDCECSDTESAQDTGGELNEDKKLHNHSRGASEDFLIRQSKLQTEARLALAQAKELAKMEIEMERMAKVTSPIADMVRKSFLKVGFPLPPGKRRMSRQILTDMNVAQLQVIVNDIHTQIEILSEELVQGLLERDDLHMTQDSKLVDIEDLSKHLSAKHTPTSVDGHTPVKNESMKDSNKSTKNSEPSLRGRLKHVDK